MKKALFLILFLVNYCICSSTTIYEIKYSFKNSQIVYTAFLVRYNNQTGFMRVRYTNADRQACVVEMDFDEVVGTDVKNGITYKTLKFEGKKPKIIMGSSGYNPDFLWFRKMNNQENYTPWGVTSPNSDGTYSQGTITNIKVLNTNEITRSYANLFFGIDEDFYVNLFNPPPSPPISNPGGTLKLVIMGNTIDTDIGSTCEKDIYRVKKEFKDIADFLNLSFDYIELSGNNFTKQKAINTLTSLTSSYNDIVIVCYTGHGFRYDGSTNAYPEFDFRTSMFQSVKANSYSLTEIYSLLNSKSARLKILLADCCNAEIGLSRALGASRASTVKSRVQWSKSNCETLFLKANGIIVGSAASKGELAYCNADMGGYFLYNFIESLDKALGVFEKDLSWQTIINETNLAVSELAKETSCKRSRCSQTTVSYIKLN